MKFKFCLKKTKFNPEIIEDPHFRGGYFRIQFVGLTFNSDFNISFLQIVCFYFVLISK